jgi:DNA-binding response OmpR family regulator
VKVFLVVEDDEDIRTLVRLQFGLDPEFEVGGEAADLTTAVEAVMSQLPDLIVLDHMLEGDVTGLAGAPLLRSAAPDAKIILFSASEELRLPASESPAIDAFLLKTQIHRLVPLSRQLLGL